MVSAQITVSQPEIAKNSLKTPILGFKVIDVAVSVPPESSSAVLVIISSKSVSICNVLVLDEPIVVKL